MDRPGHKDTKFFIGTEVEHSPAYGEKTLFVVGIQPVADIVNWAKQQQCTHIYFGANQSFPIFIDNTCQAWAPWENMITECLEQGYLCTLDIDVRCAEDLLESGLVEHHNFIPMISIKLPYARMFNYNTTIKIDDKDFQSTNPGVWCHSLHSLQKRSVFTPWSAYAQDTVIK